MTQEHRDKLETLVPQDLKVPLALMESEVLVGLLVVLVPRELLDQLVALVVLGLLVPLAPQVPLDLMEEKEKMERMVLLEFK